MYLRHCPDLMLWIHYRKIHGTLLPASYLTPHSPLLTAYVLRVSKMLSSSPLGLKELEMH